MNDENFPLGPTLSRFFTHCLYITVSIMYVVGD